MLASKIAASVYVQKFETKSKNKNLRSASVFALLIVELLLSTNISTAMEQIFNNNNKYFICMTIKELQ